MIPFVFRWVFPLVGLAFLAVGLWGAPDRGNPPLASLWGGRAETVVSAATIIETDGHHTWPRTEIRVVWPPGGVTDMPVGGLSVRRRPSQRSQLEAALARHPPGSPITVRIAGGLPYDDRTDWFALIWTLGAVFLGGLVAAVGIVANRVLR
jgi:hypothetical protein